MSFQIDDDRVVWSDAENSTTVDCVDGGCWTVTASSPEVSTACADSDAGMLMTNTCALFDFAVYTVAMGSLSTLGLIGNAVSFAVLLRDRGRSTTSFLLQALAVADSMVLVAAVPLYVVPPVHPYTGYLASYYSVYVSKMPVLWPIYSIPYTFTILITVLLSMHRYCAVCKPTVGGCGRIGTASSTGSAASATAVRLCPSTARQARNRVAILAVFSVVYNIPRFFEYESKLVCTGNGNETKMIFGISAFGENRIYRIVYANVLYFVVIHGGPLLLIAFFNVRLIMALKRRQRRWAEMGKGWYQQDVSLVLVVVMCVFIVCQTPTFVDHILWTFVDEADRQCGRWHYYYTAIGDVLVILNSSVNFVIYILTSRNFRHGLILQALFRWANSGSAAARRETATAGVGGTFSAAAGVGAASRSDVVGGLSSRRTGTTDYIGLSPRGPATTTSGRRHKKLVKPTSKDDGSVIVRIAGNRRTIEQDVVPSVNAVVVTASSATSGCVSRLLSSKSKNTAVTSVSIATSPHSPPTANLVVRYLEPRVVFR